MSTRVYFVRVMGVVLSKLFDEILAAGLQIDGISDNVSNAGQVGIDFISPPTVPEQATAQAVMDTHDGIDDEAIARAADFADVQATALAMITTLGQQLSDSQSDEADVNVLLGLPTLVQFKQQWTRAYDREQERIVGLRRVLRALRHLTKGN